MRLRLAMISERALLVSPRTRNASGRSSSSTKDSAAPHYGSKGSRPASLVRRLRLQQGDHARFGIRFDRHESGQVVPVGALAQGFGQAEQLLIVDPPAAPSNLFQTSEFHALPILDDPHVRRGVN